MAASADAPDAADVASEPGALGEILMVFVPEEGAIVAGVRVTADTGQSAVTDEFGSLRLVPPIGARRFTIQLPSTTGGGTSTFELELHERDVPSVIFRVGPGGLIGQPDVESAFAERPTAEAAVPEKSEKPEIVEFGTLTGVVLSDEDDTPVAGARVFVRGVSVEGITDAAGRFSVRVPVGKRAVSVVHAKFSTQTSDEVEVAKDRTVSTTVKLSPASLQLDDFVVTAPFIQGGVAELTATRRESTAVADVIGSEQMAKSGDTSAAAALKRVTGLTLVGGKYVYVRGMGERYSSTLLNGLNLPSPEPERRVVPLDLFPSSILQSVVVQKTYSPEMPGEFGGGAVQLRTRSIPEQFLFTINASLGYNSVATLTDGLSYRGSGTDWLGFDDGTRALPKAIAQTPSVRAFDGSAEELEALGDSFEPNYQLFRQTVPFNHSLGVSVGDRFDIGFPVGVMASAFYRRNFSQTRSFLREVLPTNDDREALIYNGANYAIEETGYEVNSGGMLVLGAEPANNQRIEANTLVLRMSEFSALRLDGVDEESDLFRTYQLDWIERQLFTQQLTGEHSFSLAEDKDEVARAPKLSWRAGYSLAERDQPDRRRYLASTNAQVYVLEPDAGTSQRFFADLEDKMSEGALDFQWPFQFGEVWKFTPALGGRVSERTRDVGGRRFQFKSSGRGQLSGLGYRSQLPDQVLSRERIDPEGFVLEEATQSDPLGGGSDTYQSRMSIVAAYIMQTSTLFDDLDVMAGLRVERALQITESYDQFNPEVRTTARLDNLDLLPASTATWRFLEDMQLRGGFGVTVSRPDFREISLSRAVDVKAGITLRGTPELERALIRNYDVRWEWYPSPDESVSVGAFYKDFNRPIELLLLGGAGKVWTWRNSKRATNVGVELEARKSLAFLGEWGRRLTGSGNLALIQSEIELQTDKEGEASAVATNPKRPLQGQSPYVLNATLEYDGTVDSQGLTASLLYNVFGPRIMLPGAQGIPDAVEEPFHRLDFVTSYALDRWRLGLKAQNLINPRQRLTQTKDDVTLLRAAFLRGRVISLNASWSY